MSEFNEEPPSYDHAVQSQSNQVFKFGKYHDASLDSFQNGELFIQAYFNRIDQFPTEEISQVQQYKFINCIHLDITAQHPKASPQLPSAIQTGPHTFEFWPTLNGYLEDSDFSIQASHAFLKLSNYNSNLLQPTVHYFELTLLRKAHTDVVLSIGLSTKPYPLFRMPGWNKYSVGYHSDDGHKFCDDATGGQPYGPVWSLGDTVGCGYCPEQGRVFFTLNGILIGDAFQFLQSHHYYPTIGADGPAQISINFGNLPFKYNVQDWAGQYI